MYIIFNLKDITTESDTDRLIKTMYIIYNLKDITTS